MSDRDIVRQFMSSLNLMSISSTSAEGYPQSALVEFAETDDLNIIFDTYAHFRKIRNLRERPRVALVFDDRTSITVQYEGIVKEAVGSEIAECMDIYLAKLPEARRFVEIPETRWFVVRPIWIRYTNVNLEPWEIRELTF